MGWLLRLALQGTLLGYGATALAQTQPDWIRGKSLTLRPHRDKPPRTVRGRRANLRQRAVIVERRGQSRSALDGQMRYAWVFDLTASVGVFSEEEDLVGLAFDSAFATNGRLYVDYTATDWSVHVVRYSRSAADPSELDTTSAEDVLVIPKQSRYHNGGTLAFAPDGYLYASVGDDQASDQAQQLDGLVG